MTQNTFLRQLFADYSNGNLSFSEYRHRRTQFIDEFTGEITVRNDEFSPPTNPSYQAPHKEDDHQDANTKPKSSKSLPIILTTLSLLVLVGYYAIHNNYLSVPTNSNSHLGTSDKTSETHSHKITSQMCQSLLELKEWKIADIEEFISKWENLPDEIHSYASKTACFHQLIDNANRRITEQRALADIGDKNAVHMEKHIQTLITKLTNNQ